jgi:hypothetical protein
MTGRLARFTQSDLDRILKAAKKAGVDVRVRIAPDGAIIVETGKMTEAPNEEMTPEKGKRITLTKCKRTAPRFPRYVVPKRMSGGMIGFYFDLPSWARRDPTCPVANETLGTDFAAAVMRAESVLLPQFDAWRRSRNSDIDAATSAVKIGTLDWLFNEYKKTWPLPSAKRLKGLSSGQQRNYRSSITLVGDYLMKNGRRLGTLSLRAIDGPFVDDLFLKLLYTIDRNGNKIERRTTVNAAMKMCPEIRPICANGLTGGTMVLLARPTEFHATRLGAEHL